LHSPIFFDLAAPAPSDYEARHGLETKRLAILVPPVCNGGLGSCTHSKTPKPPHHGGFRFSELLVTKSADSEAASGQQPQEQDMSRSSFDFDVITGPSAPRPRPKPTSKPIPAQGTQPQPVDPGK
jgi:hypothetical protein